MYSKVPSGRTGARNPGSFVFAPTLIAMARISYSSGGRGQKRAERSPDRFDAVAAVAVRAVVLRATLLAVDPVGVVLATDVAPCPALFEAPVPRFTVTVVGRLPPLEVPVQDELEQGEPDEIRCEPGPGLPMVWYAFTLLGCSARFGR